MGERPVKHFTLITLILIAITTFISPCGAADNLAIKGDYLFRGRYEQNTTHSDVQTDDNEYFHQRLRTDIWYTLSEVVKVRLRADWNEGAYGHNVNRAGVPNTSEDRRALQIDRALVQFSKPKFDVTLGLQQHIRNGQFGFVNVFSPQASGLAIQLRLPVIIDIHAFKASEGDSTGKPALVDSTHYPPEDPDDPEAEMINTEDTNLYAAQISYVAKSFSAGAYYAAKNDLRTDDNPQAACVWLKTNAGPFSLGVGLDQFFGKNDGKNTDYVGTQLYLETAFTATDSVKVGGHGYYAMGTDKTDETVISSIEVWGPWVPAIIHGLPGITWDGIGILAGPHTFGYFKAKDRDAENAGSVGADIWIEFNLAPFKFSAQAYYFVPQEDSVTEKESEMGISGGVDYKVLDNTSLILGVLYTTPDFDDDYEDANDIDIEPSIGVEAEVRVKF